jgi:hypothetical protein
VGNRHAEFETWWQRYLRQAGREAAAEADRQAQLEATADGLASAPTAAALRWQADGGQERHARYPASGLEQRRWEDQGKETAASTAPAKPIELVRLSAGSLLATQGRARYEALLAGGPRRAR